MNRSSHFRRALVGTICATVAVGLAVAVGPATNAGAVVAPNVAIVSPSFGQTVSGSVAFTVSIDQEDAAHPVTQVYLQIFGLSQSWQAQVVDVTPGQCAPTCVIGATFDTSTLVVPTNPDPAQYRPDLPDGFSEFAADVYTSFGPTGFAHADIEIDNHRPTVVLPDLPIDPLSGSQPPWTGTGSITTQVQATPDPITQAPVTSYRLMVPNYPVIALSDVSVPAPAGDIGMITVDVRSVRPGTYLGYLVGVTDAGTTSQLMRVSIVVGRPYSLSAHVDWAYSDQARVTVTPHWLDGSTAAQTWVTGATADIAGVRVATANGLTDSHDSFQLTLAEPDGSGLPVDVPTITITATDNFGISATALTWAVGAAWTPGQIVAGASTNVKVTIHDSSPSPIHDVALASDGTVLASAIGDGSTNPVLIAAPPSTRFTAGAHDLTATVTLNDGQTHVLHRTVTALLPVAVTLSAPASTTWGSRVTLTARATSNATGVPGLHLALQSRAIGSTSWTTRVSTTTSATGGAAFAVASSWTGNADWRVVSGATTTRLSGVSSLRRMVVKARFGNVPSAATKRHGQTVRQYVTVAPYQTGLHVTLQYQLAGRTTWTALTRPAVAHTGKVTLSYSLSKPGRYHLRLVRPGTRLVTTTASHSWSLNVTR
jgi:hypothetical protein